MFEGYSAETCTGKFLLMPMGGLSVNILQVAGALAPEEFIEISRFWKNKRLITQSERKSHNSHIFHNQRITIERGLKNILCTQIT